MEFIDTHSHLYLKEFDQDIDEVIQRARKEKVNRIVLPNIDSSTIQLLHFLADSYPDCCIPLMGLHPTHVKDNYKEELELILNQLDTFNYKGIGEIGIDLYWDKSFFEEQKYAFRTQLDYSINKNIPVVIHARESLKEIIDIVSLPEYQNLRGIFHAFTGNLKQAVDITDRGFKLGIGGIVTFKNSGLQEVVINLPLSCFVLETDSPFLAPVPFRGKRNESSFIPLIAQKIAEIKDVSIQEIAEVTSRNSREIFSL